MRGVLFATVALVAATSFAGRLWEPADPATTNFYPRVGAPEGTLLDVSSERGCVVAKRDLATGDRLDVPVLSSSLCVFVTPGGDSVARLVTYDVVGEGDEAAVDVMKPKEAKTSSPVIGSRFVPKLFLMDGIGIVWLGLGGGAVQAEGK